MDEPGTIYNAEVHQSAQRLLKVHRITNYVKFCKCCSLPQETPGIVVPFNFCDKQLDFGLGIYLYFYYIKFILVMSIICMGLSSVTTIVFCEKYSSDIKKYCKEMINDNNTDSNTLLRNLDDDFDFKDLLENCYKYISIKQETIDEYDLDVNNIIKLDWMNKMSTYNLKYYYQVFKYEAEKNQYDNIDSIILDFSFIYFLTGITVLIANYLLKNQNSLDIDYSHVIDIFFM